MTALLVKQCALLVCSRTAGLCLPAEHPVARTCNHIKACLSYTAKQGQFNQFLHFNVAKKNKTTINLGSAFMSQWLNTERWKSIFLLLWCLHCFLSVTLNRFYPLTGWKGRGLHQHIQLQHRERWGTQEEIVRTKPHRELRSKALKSETCEDVLQYIHWFFFFGFGQSEAAYLLCELKRVSRLSLFSPCRTSVFKVRHQRFQNFFFAADNVNDMSKWVGPSKAGCSTVVFFLISSTLFFRCCTV